MNIGITRLNLASVRTDMLVTAHKHLPTLHNRLSHVIRYARVWWRSLNLSGKFLVVAILPIGLNLLIMGNWVSDQVTDRVVNQEAAATALYVDSFIEPLLQDLARGEHLSPSSLTALKTLLASKPFSDRIVSFKIGNTQNTVIFSDKPELIGGSFPLTDTLRAALSGQVIAEFDHLEDEENATERELGMALLEIYVPVRETSTGRVIAIAETYEVGERLKADVKRIRLNTWLIVSLLMLTLMGLLMVIVRQGSKTILRQRHAMQRQISRLIRLLDEVRTLRASVDESHRRAAESMERFVRRLGSDLHDGPAQHVGLALLHLGEINAHAEKTGHEGAKRASDKIDELLSDALDELRTISAGLAPPQLDGLSLREALLLAVRNHEWRTGTQVTVGVDKLDGLVPPLMKMTLYRFVQEGLKNAFSHAGGAGQRLRAVCSDDKLVVEVSDSGPGISADSGEAHRPKLGLSIMRDRVESLGGVFEIESKPDSGTTVRATFMRSAGVCNESDTHSSR